MAIVLNGSTGITAPDIDVTAQSSDITTTGDVTAVDATLSGDLTTSGVYLGGTGSANYLDDYEEGTWTPYVEGGTTAGTGTYSDQYGTYVKVGSLVHLNFKVYYSAHTGSGNYRLKGLPFINGSNLAASTGSVMMYQVDLDNSTVTVTSHCGENEDAIIFLQTRDNGTWVILSVANNNDYLFGSITLKVDI